MPIMLSERIRESRVAMGLSQEAFAQRLGVDRRTPERWEAGKTEPRAAQLRTIADVTGASIEWLLGVVPDAPNDEAALLRRLADQMIDELATRMREAAEARAWTGPKRRRTDRRVSEAA